MSNVFLTIKMCCVYNEWYDISCATLYLEAQYRNFRGRSEKAVKTLIEGNLCAVRDSNWALPE